jgi:hypothetical protein
MKLHYIKSKKLYLPDCYPYEVNKKGVLEYFIYGEGWKKTKSFTVVPDVELPDKWSELSWLQITEYMDLYGIEVANTYAETKTAGIVSRQTVYGYHFIYKQIKHLAPFDAVFFECLKVDYFLACIGTGFFDIVATDKALSDVDKEYNGTECIFRTEKNVSMNNYVQQKYGDKAVQIIDTLIKS